MDGRLLAELFAAALEGVAKFLPEEPRPAASSNVQPVATSGDQQPADNGQPVAGSLVVFRHRRFHAEMQGRVVRIRSDGRFEVRPLAMRWGSRWERVTYTRHVLVREVRPLVP